MTKLRTHFTPDEFGDVGICGTIMGDIEGSSSWDYVDCKKCLKLKAKYIKSVELDNKRISDEMGDFVDFMNSSGRWENNGYKEYQDEKHENRQK